MRIAFAGNPNSGKTTMYNALTGRNEKVGNWAGVTVDKKEAPIKRSFAGDLELIAVDLPGAYSMSPFTSEESITSGYVKNEHSQLLVVSRDLSVTEKAFGVRLEPYKTAKLRKSAPAYSKESDTDYHQHTPSSGTPWADRLGQHWMPGMMSRKKQVLPFLMDAFNALD